MADQFYWIQIFYLQHMINIKAAVLLHTTGRFVLVGILGAIIELILFSGLVRAGLEILYSNFIAFHFAFALCFFLHYHYTHQKPYEGAHRIAGGFIKYAGLMYAQFIVGSLLLWFLIDKLGWIAEIAKIVQIGAVTPVSYIIQKLVVFQREKSI